MGGINHDQFFILSASTLLQRQMVMLLYNTPWVVPTTLFFFTIFIQGSYRGPLGEWPTQIWRRRWQLKNPRPSPPSSLRLYDGNRNRDPVASCVYISHVSLLLYNSKSNVYTYKTVCGLTAALSCWRNNILTFLSQYQTVKFKVKSSISRIDERHFLHFTDRIIHQSPSYLFFCLKYSRQHFLVLSK